VLFLLRWRRSCVERALVLGVFLLGLISACDQVCGIMAGGAKPFGFCGVLRWHGRRCAGVKMRFWNDEVDCVLRESQEALAI
jgi:hypothetical protein